MIAHSAGRGTAVCARSVLHRCYIRGFLNNPFIHHARRFRFRRHVEFDITVIEKERKRFVNLANTG